SSCQRGRVVCGPVMNRLPRRRSLLWAAGQNAGDRLADGSVAVQPRGSWRVVRSGPGISTELVLGTLRERHPLLVARTPWLLVAGIVAYAGIAFGARQSLGVPVPVLGGVALAAVACAVTVGPRFGVRGLPRVRPVSALAFVVILAMALN